MNELQQIKDRLEAATPGPWRWSLNPEIKLLHLSSTTHFRPFIMRFKRWGMNSAIPEFRDSEEDLMQRSDKFGIRRRDHHNFDLDINHPDAQLIAHSPADIKFLLNLVEEQQTMLKMIEWTTDIGLNDKYCPVCGRRQNVHGYHENYCQLAKLLKGVEPDGNL